MCGIVCFIGKYKDIHRAELHKVERALELIKHRGIDNTSIKRVNDRIIMGHNLLSITGDFISQPLSWNGCHIVHNGEFYHYENLSCLRNITLKTDSYLPLFQYNQNRKITTETMKDLHGEFAFCLFDEIRNIFFAVRDRYGIKPLYYINNDEYLVFASEVKAFKAFTSLVFDEKVIHQVLSMQYHGDYNTLFKNVNPVVPGQFLQIDLNSTDFEIKKHKYWDITYTSKQPRNKFCFFNYLKNSVKVRVNTQREIGYALSGGIDSSAIVGLSEEENKSCYTMSFPENEVYDEVNLAQDMANYTGSNLCRIQLDNKTLFENLKQSIYHSEEVAMNLHVASKYLMFQKMHNDGKRISLGGEGADEIFLGYAHLQKDYSQDYQVLPHLLGVHLEDRISKYNVPEFLKAKLNMGEGLVENFVDGSFYSSFAVNDHLNELKENFAVIFQDRIYEAAYYWSKICLSNYILVGLGDKLEMAHSIEGRVPFLDTFLVESVNHLPLDLKMQGKKEKQILRNELVDTVIPSILKRTKHPLLANPSIADCQAFIVQELERLCSYDLPYFSRNKLQKFLIQIANDRFKEREFSQLIIVLSVLYLYETLIIN